MRRETVQRSAGAAIAGLLAWCASALQAQAPDDGPLVVGEPREKLKFFELHRLEAALDLTGIYTRNERRPAGAPDVTGSERIFQESVDLGFQAFFGHQNLLDLTGNVELGLEQRWAESSTPGLSEQGDQTLWLYDVNGRILGAGPMPVTLYSRRDQTFFNREFAGTIESINQEHGAIFDIRSAVAPTTIQVFHREQDQNDTFGQTDFSLVQDSANVQSALRLASNQTLRLEYSFDSIDESQSGLLGQTFGQKYDQHDASAIHELRFGQDEVHNLRSDLHYYEQSGDVNYKYLSLDEQLLLQHTARLSSWYTLFAQDLQSEDSPQRIYRGSAQLRHRLFDSLASSVSVGAARTEASEDQFTSDEWFARASFDYTKRVPYGQLDLGLNVGFDRENNSERGAALVVRDDPRTFNDPLPITINRRNIVVGSVVVTDSTGFRTYQDPSEYRVDYFPDRIELRRVVGGPIANGQTVLVDYELGPEPANTIDATGLGLSARYGISEGPLSGLAAYISYQQIDFGLDAVDPSQFVLDNSRRTRYGLEYNRGGFSVLGEQEILDSDVNPYDLSRVQGRYTRRLGVGSVVNLTASYDQINYGLTGDRLELSVLTAEWAQRVTSELDFRVWINFRDENDRIADDTRGSDQALELRWRRRQTEVTATLSNTINETRNEDTNNQYIRLGIRRAF